LHLVLERGGSVGMSIASSTSTETQADLMLVSHRTRLLILWAELSGALHQGTVRRHIEREIGQLEASITRLRRVAL
jgi:hypothetical protein